MLKEKIIDDLIIENYEILSQNYELEFQNYEILC